MIESRELTISELIGVSESEHVEQLPADVAAFWRPGEVRRIPAMFARAQDCLILHVDDHEIRFRTAGNREATVTRALLRQLHTAGM